MIRNIEIRAVLNGFVCTVGCQTVVFNDIPSLTHALTEYLRDPEKTEAVWTKDSINAKHTLRLGQNPEMCVPAPPPPPPATACDPDRPRGIPNR